jgi:hypothetical protein
VGLLQRLLRLRHAQPLPAGRAPDGARPEADADSDADAEADANANADQVDSDTDTDVPVPVPDPDPDIPDPDIPDPDIPDPDVPDADVPDPDVPDADVPDPDIPVHDVHDIGGHVSGTDDEHGDTDPGTDHAVLGAVSHEHADADRNGIGHHRPTERPRAVFAQPRVLYIPPGHNETIQ